MRLPVQTVEQLAEALEKPNANLGDLIACLDGKSSGDVVYVKTDNEAICAKCDLPSAGLIKDLKSRGLLDDVIVLWTGEFGRLPVSQNGKGRDHNRNAFSLILAGGGFKTGHVHGTSDDVGYKAADKPVSVPDLHATLLHQLGLDHNRLTYHHHGRDETLTDASLTKAKVVAAILRRPSLV